MDDALRAYDAGRSDGLAGTHDDRRAGDDPDYRMGVVDGRIAKFEATLLEAIRKALG
nr:hypothetical protein [uncultured Actinoplanes sp.]